MQNLREQLSPKNARLCVVWVAAEPEVCRQGMIQRNSGKDTWKLAHRDEYLKTTSFEIPKTIDNPNDEYDVLLFYNSNRQQYDKSMVCVVHLLERA